MSIRRVFIGAAAAASILVIAFDTAQANEDDLYVDQVLRVFVLGGDHIQELRSLRDKTERYPEVVGALSDYAIFGHGTLLDLLFEEAGPEVVVALDKKLRTDVNCLAEYLSICQPTLADRNQVILSTLSYYEDEMRAK